MQCVCGCGTSLRKNSSGSGYVLGHMPCPVCLKLIAPHQRGNICCSRACAKELRFPSAKCNVINCERRAAVNGLCTTHYVRTQRGTSLEIPIKPVAPKGSGSIDGQGYRRIAGRKEHHIVMERILGRARLPHEEVHHKNGIRADNRPENLELWVRSQPPGQRVSDQVVWATEILKRYAPDLLADRVHIATAAGPGEYRSAS